MGQSSSSYHEPPSPARAVSAPHNISASSVKPMDMDGRQALEQAVREMKECADVFASWRRSLDYSSSNKPSDLEIELRSQIGSLEDSALAALNETEAVVRAHKSLGVLMSRRLSGSGDITLKVSPELTRLIEEIQRRSTTVSSHAGRMRDQVQTLVETLERPQRTKKLFFQRLLGWLKKILHAVASALSAFALASLFVFQPAAAGFSAGSALANAAASVVSDLEAGRTPNFDVLLRTLRETIPAQAFRVSERLNDFQYCHRLLQNELEMQKGALYALDAQEARQARAQWDIHNAQLELIPVRS